MLYFKLIISLIVLVNNGFTNGFTIKKIYDDKIFYNFVSYESDLYVSSNKGIYKVTASGDDITLHDASIVGPINSIFQKNNNYIQSLFHLLSPGGQKFSLVCLPPFATMQLRASRRYR